MKQLIARYRRLIDETPTDFTRYLAYEIAWDARLVGIHGAKGVGKSTMVLQHLKLHDDLSTALYIDAGDIYFASHRLLNFAETFYINGGKRLYIDEIHRYPNWSTELKGIYDYLPGLSVVYTGSSILDLEAGGADLSRRKLEYHLEGLSFREYLELRHKIMMPVVGLNDVLAGKVAWKSRNTQPLPLFREYLHHGYYPFFSEPEYGRRLLSALDTTLEIDIARFAKLTATSIDKLKRLFYIIAQSVPFKPNVSELAKMVGMARSDLSDALVYLEKGGVISRLCSAPAGMQMMTKPEKIYLGNTNLSYALSDDEPNSGNLRETAFEMMTRVKGRPTASGIADFMLDRHTFEVGGRGKSQRQIAGVRDSYVVKDDTEHAIGNSIPLWHFGFLY